MRFGPASPRTFAALVAALGLGVLAPRDASAQVLTLRDLLSDFLARGITLAPPAVGTDHSAHFTAADSRQFRALQLVNTEIARQLSNFPLSSSAGGFAYTFDPDLGTFTRPTRSFGPMFTERAFSIGKGKLNVGLNFTHHAFDHLDDLDLADGDVNLVFEHIDSNNDGSLYSFYFEGDLVTASVALDVETTTTAFVASYGVTDRLDLGVAVPLVEVDIDAVANAKVERLATGTGADRETHTFTNGTDHASFRQSGSASGLGDALVRAKYRFTGTAGAVMAVSGEVRLPTGDERNLLGTGEAEARGQLIGTWNAGTLAPHFNIGYGVAGGDLPNDVTASLGFDYAADPRITIVADLLHRNQSGVRRAYNKLNTYTANTAASGPPVIVSKQLPSLSSEDASRSTLTGTAGFKINLAGNLLLSMIGSFPLNDEGLRDKFTPLIGLDYSY